MKKIASFLLERLGAVTKLGSFLIVFLLLVLSVACTSSEDKVTEGVVEEEVQEEAKEVVEEEVIQEEPEEVVEVLPVPRKDSLTGGIQVVTPEGLNSQGIELQLLDDKQVAFIELDGLEWRKSYDVQIVSDSLIDQQIKMFLLDANKIDDITSLDISSLEASENALDMVNKKTDGIILASYEVTSEEEINNILMTNSIRSTNKGMLYIVIENNQDLLTLDDVLVKRHIGELKFNDEFEYEGLLSDEWTYETGGNGWGNGELQYYTGEDIDNAKVSQGEFVITAQEEKIDNNDYSSARVRTKQSFKYGRYEISAKLPYGRGTWPAIWMLPQGNNYGNWPNSGEIDIMEHVGFDMDVVHASLHMSDFNFRKNNHPTSIMTIPEVDAKFHTYSLEWTPYQMDMYIDDYHYLSFKNDGQGPKHWPYDEKFYLILNIAIGGAWGAQEGVDPIFPQELVVDYVRIYDLEDEVIDMTPPNAVDNVDISVQGATVFYAFEPVEDDYKVSHYEAIFTKGNEIVTKSITDTNGFVYDLEESSEYNFELFAVDESGNYSESFSRLVETESVISNTAGEWITPDSTYFISGATINELDSLKYIAGFEAGNLMAYHFDLEQGGEYQLELEISAKLFDGEIMLLNNDQEEIMTFIARKTGDKNLYEIVTTEKFTLEEGEQTLFLQTIKNGYQIKNVRLIKIQ